MNEGGTIRTRPNTTAKPQKLENMTTPEFTNEEVKALKAYQFPSKAKIPAKAPKMDIINSISKSMGWDILLSTLTEKQCKIKLSKRQKQKLNDSYSIVISCDIKHDYLWLTIFNDDFYNPVKYCKMHFLTNKELRWLANIF